MRKATKIAILAGFLTVIATSFVFLNSALAYVEQYGWESTNANGMVSQVKIQAHAVYNENNQGGVTAYGIWIHGIYDLIFCTKVVVYIYLSTEYYYEEINWKTMEYFHYTYWDPSPSTFMSWDGEYSYNSAVPGEWTWTAGGEAYGMSLSASYKANPYARYRSENSVSGDYRYLGWFKSEYDMFGGHEFSALLKLHLINDEAQKWANGIYSYNYYVEQLTKITNLRIKLVFNFYFYANYIWWLQSSRTYILGDGSPATDLNYIPLTSGSVP